MKTTSLLKTVLLLLFIAATAYSRVIQVPYVTSDDTLHLKMEELHKADSVFRIFGNLSRIYQKEVLAIVQGNEVPFPSCYEEPPQSTFWAYSQLPLGESTVKKDPIIYDFEQIKYPRNLIDIETYGNKVYFVKEDGVITVATISQDLSKVTVNKRINTEISKIATGNIIILPNATDGTTVGYGLFITVNQAILFDLNGDKFSPISNLNSMRGYQRAISIDGRYLAGAFGADGAKIFSIDFNVHQLKLEAQFNSSSLKQKTVNIKDVTFDPNRKTLFILDHHIGVIPIELIFQANTLVTRPTSSIIKNSLCNLIYYDGFNDQLYLNCRQLHKYRIHSWPLFTQKVLPRQEISIREITSDRDLVALVGRSVFELISSQRKVAVYDDRLLDKLVLKDNFFVSGNENYLLVGNYEIIPPSITCFPNSTEALGRHKVLFQVTAECNSAYFKSIMFEPGPLSNDDKCVYSVYRNVKIWKGKAIEAKLFIYFSMIIAALGLGVLVYWAASYFNLRKLQHQLRNYQSLEEDRFGQASSSSEGKKAGEGMEQKPVMNQKASDNQGRHELNEDIDVPSDVHDIE